MQCSASAVVSHAYSVAREKLILLNRNVDIDYSRPAKYSIWCERAVTLAGRARNRSLLASVCYIVNWNKCLTSVNCRLARITTRVLIYRRSFDTTRIAIRDDLAARSPCTIRDPIS